MSRIAAFYLSPDDRMSGWNEFPQRRIPVTMKSALNTAWLEVPWQLQFQR